MRRAFLLGVIINLTLVCFAEEVLFGSIPQFIYKADPNFVVDYAIYGNSGEIESLSIADRIRRIGITAPVSSQYEVLNGFGETFEDTDNILFGSQLLVPANTPVLSMCNGTIIKTEYSPSLFGYYVVVVNTQVIEPIYFLFAHLGQLSVAVGTEVQQGDLIGLSGSTGATLDPILFVCAIYDKYYVDPLSLFE